MSEGSLSIIWGETHHNTFMGGRQDPPLEEVLAFARTHLDFYTAAYYTPLMRRIPVRPDWKPLLPPAAPPPEGYGFLDEGWKPPAMIEREWRLVERATAEAYEPDRFVTLPGYEWQGDGTWGDHNVIHRREGWRVEKTDTLPDLQARLRLIDAIAIPHHTGYVPGLRAPRWTTEDERLSPFSEIFSIHGCSETDEEWGGGLRRNLHMGPGEAGGTWQAALDAGLHIGAIASTDNWSNVPGCWGQGLAAALVSRLTRDDLWEAFCHRRVYGVTGDRIAMDFQCNHAPMGTILPYTPERRIAVQVRGWDALDRIEILKNGRVVAVHHHPGTWSLPQAGSRTRWRFRLEAGWGPREREFPLGNRRWRFSLDCQGGTVTGWSPCWTVRGSTPPVLAGDRASFELLSVPAAVGNAFQTGICLELDAYADCLLTIRAGEMEWTTTLGEWARGSRVLWDRADVVRLIREATGTDPATLHRGDPVLFHLAYKVKAHRPVPQSGYSALLHYTDREPVDREIHYRVRVEQRNGQRAWSSPIWVQPPGRMGSRS